MAQAPVKVAVCGSGKVVPAVVKYLRDQGCEVTLLCRNAARATAIKGQDENVTIVAVDFEKDAAKLPDLLKNHGAVISLLPPALHVPLAKVAVAAKIHFVCPSYSTADFEAVGADAQKQGTAVVVECGFFPGLDYVFLKKLLGQPAADHKITKLVALGGLVPPVDEEANPLNFKSYCNTRDVIQSVTTAVKQKDEGKEVDIPAANLLAPDHVHPLAFMHYGPTESYPTRDGSVFATRLGCADCPTSERGVLVRPEFPAAMHAISTLGFLGSEECKFGGMTVAAAVAAVLKVPPEKVAEHLRAQVKEEATLKAVTWLLTADGPLLAGIASPRALLHYLMDTKMKAADADVDVALMHLTVASTDAAGKPLEKHSTIILSGAENRATPRVVGLPLAIVAIALSKKTCALTGLVRPEALGSVIIEPLAAAGVTFVEEEVQKLTDAEAAATVNRFKERQGRVLTRKARGAGTTKEATPAEDSTRSTLMSKLQTLKDLKK